jgi:hypothetical protein
MKPAFRASVLNLSRGLTVGDAMAKAMSVDSGRTAIHATGSSASAWVLGKRIRCN